MSAWIFIATHPAEVWGALAALFLVVELATGSGWLLWPCAAAALAALVALWPPSTWPAELLLFAVLTVVFTVIGRRWMARRRAGEHAGDLNDQSAQLVGRIGEVSAPFEQGRGRVFVSGKDWAADIEPPAEAPVGASVKVLALLSSSRLKVARA